MSDDLDDEVSACPKCDILKTEIRENRETISELINQQSMNDLYASNRESIVNWCRKYMSRLGIPIPHPMWPEQWGEATKKAEARIKELLDALEEVEKWGPYI